jgi:hypothetical protein
MSPTTLVSALVLLVAPTAAGASARSPECELGRSVKWIETLGALPSSVRSGLLARAHDMADTGQPFNQYDYGDGPRHRFIAGGQVGSEWFVWYEHGGRAHHRHVVFFEVGMVDAKGSAPPLAMANFVSSNLCTATRAYLEGVHPAANFDW